MGILAHLIRPGLPVGPWQCAIPPAVIQQKKWLGLKSYSSDDLVPLFFSLYLYGSVREECGDWSEACVPVAVEDNQTELEQRQVL